MSRYARPNSKPQQQTGQSNITAGHVRAFQAVRSQLYDNITLTSCTINGEGGVAIVMLDRVNDEQMAVMPLFVAITPQMMIEFEGEAGAESDNRAPTRYDVLREQGTPTPSGAD